MIWRPLLPTLMLLGCVAPPEAGSEPAANEGARGLRLGEERRIGDIAVRALRVLEDSRCPVNVQCVQAGTVRLAVGLADGAEPRQAVLRLDEAQRLSADRWILLAAVCPVPRAPNPIESGDYRFFVTVADGGPPPPLDFACPRDP